MRHARARDGEAHRLLCHSILDLRVIKTKKGEEVVTQCGTRVLETVGPAPPTLPDLSLQPFTKSIVNICTPHGSILYTGSRPQP